jgi:hypothetical protein
MLSFEGLALRRAVSRAKQLHAAGDAAAARWAYLLWAVGEAGGSIEERLEVLRRAAEAVPYDTALIDAAVEHLMRAAVMIGDRRYLHEATTIVDRFEEVLGPSIDSVLMRAALAQLEADEERTLDLCGRAEEMLSHHPNPRAKLKLGLCLASVKRREKHGMAMAEAAAAMLKDPSAYAYLAAIVEVEDPGRAEGYVSTARLLGSRSSLPDGHVDGLISRAREDVRLEREFLENV